MLYTPSHIIQIFDQFRLGLKKKTIQLLDVSSPFSELESRDEPADLQMTEIQVVADFQRDLSQHQGARAGVERVKANGGENRDECEIGYWWIHRDSWDTNGIRMGTSMNIMECQCYIVGLRYDRTRDA